MKIFAFTLDSSDYLAHTMWACNQFITAAILIQSYWWLICTKNNHKHFPCKMDFWQLSSSGVFQKPRRKQNTAPPGRSLSVTSSLEHADSTDCNGLLLLHLVSFTVLAASFLYAITITPFIVNPRHFLPFNKVSNT